MSQSTQPTRLDDVSYDTPACVRVTNRADEAWYTYDGELLFDPSVIRQLDERYDEMENTEFSQPDDVRLKIRTKDKESCEAELEDRLDSIDDEFGFIYVVDQLFTPHHSISEEGPRKSVAWASYRSEQHAGLGGAEYKRNKLFLPVREYEQWVYHNRVWLPIVEEYHEKYPY